MIIIDLSREQTFCLPFMSGQVVRPGEASLADHTLKRLLSGMNAYVPGQLVGPAEAFVAFVHRTSVWPFA